MDAWMYLPDPLTMFIKKLVENGVGELGEGDLTDAFFGCFGCVECVECVECFECFGWFVLFCCLAYL